jgi:glycosyltransferase involved in cell wall biosynthesis
MKYSIYIKWDRLHHKNKIGLKFIIDKYFIEVFSIEEADICYFPCHSFDTLKFPNKKFIFGCHFDVFPNKDLRNINNKYNNSIYIQPSDWVNDLYMKEYNVTNIPIYTLPFPPDINIFKPDPENSIKNNDCFIYFKRRKQEELIYIKEFLITKGYNPIIFDYVKTYNENDYLKTLQKCKFGIYIGSHESQGFALIEALCINIPLLVWNVTQMSQEFGCPELYYNIKTIATTVPYWYKDCGELFYNKDEFEETFNKFINNLDNYKPREKIIELLSIDKIYENYWVPILQYFKLV